MNVCYCVLCLVSAVLAKRLAWKNISKMAYSVSSGTWNLNSKYLCVHGLNSPKSQSCHVMCGIRHLLCLIGSWSVRSGNSVTSPSNILPPEVFFWLN